MRIFPVCLPVLLLAACTMPTRVQVDHQMGLDGAWQVPKENAPSLDATGDVVTLRFMDRLFVFNIAKCRGFIDENEVRLYGDGHRILVTPERVQVEFKGQVTGRPLSELPRNRRIVYRDGALVIE